MNKNINISDEQYVIFKLGEEYYGVDIYNVKTIEKVSQFTRVPNSPNYIKGVINLRGEVVAVMDIRKRLGLDSIEIDNDTRIIIVNDEDMVLGLMVDSSSEVIQLNNNEIDNPPSIGDSISSEYINGIGKKDGRIIILLNLSKILGLD